MRIAEVSEKYNLTQDTLRYYERIGLIPPVSRNESGIRDYNESDCRWIEFIKCMRSAGLAIEVLIEYVDLFQQGESTALERKALLIDQRDQLIHRIKEMQETLQRLNGKIERYERCILPIEDELKTISVK
ncbi:MAG: MerR family transcriptional regulator [Anaerofustis sp.]